MTSSLILIATYLAAAAMTTWFHEETLEYDITLKAITVTVGIITAALHVTASPLTAFFIAATLLTPSWLRAPLLGVLTSFITPAVSVLYLITQATQVTNKPNTITYAVAAITTILIAST